jgi:anti-sigma28 factor (negative regulator of flagellin synthesis)
MIVHKQSRLRGPLTQNNEQWQSERRPEVVIDADPPVRADLVARIKAQIADGTYDTPEKFEAAFLEMLRRIDAD